jgi:hypothetical protein
MDVWRFLLILRMALLNSHLWPCARFLLLRGLFLVRLGLMRRLLSGTVTIDCSDGGFEMTRSVCKGGCEGAMGVYMRTNFIYQIISIMFLTSSPCTMVRQNSKLSKVHGSKTTAGFKGAKTKQPISCLGKPLSPAKYSTFEGQRPGILLTPRIEQVTFVSHRTPFGLSSCPTRG